MEIIKTQKGFLTIIAGKTDMGKSTITIFDCAEHLKQNQKALFFSYEYCQSIIYNKLVSHFNMQWKELYKLKIMDANGVPLDLLMNYIRVKRPETNVIYIDYLDLLVNATYGEGENPEDNIQFVIKELANLAAELNVAIVLLTQIGAEKTVEQTVEHLNRFGELLPKPANIIRMFIWKGNLGNSIIDYSEVSQIIDVDGNNLRHFSSVNIKTLYND